ncbi:unnamed protein product [Adineta ricciae]|nr:unnamed protein product [Adineta ricciae]
MRSNGNLSMTDTRRISPQTTSSSGYHSDLSSATSTNESPQSIHEILPIQYEKATSSSSAQTQKKTLTLTTNSTHDKSVTNKNLSRLSSFIRKQYERAKSKLTSKPLSSSTYVPTSTVPTCSKATSTTPLSHLSEETYTMASKQNSISNPKSHYLSSVYKQNSYTEPVYSVYVQPIMNNKAKRTTQQQQQQPQSYKNYASIHECYSHQPSYRYSAINNTSQYSSSSSYRRLATMANFENTNYYRRHNYYPAELSSSYLNYYPYRYTNKNYDYSRSNYVSLSDTISTKTSAFTPIGQKAKSKQLYQRPTYNIYEQIPPSDDPCDLEVAQYFPHTSQWSNPNYFDIYAKDTNIQKPTYAETLC